MRITCLFYSARRIPEHPLSRFLFDNPVGTLHHPANDKCSRALEPISPGLSRQAPMQPVGNKRFVLIIHPICRTPVLHSYTLRSATRRPACQYFFVRLRNECGLCLLSRSYSLMSWRYMGLRAIRPTICRIACIIHFVNALFPPFFQKGPESSPETESPMGFACDAPNSFDTAPIPANGC